MRAQYEMVKLSNSRVATFLLIFGAHMNIWFSLIVKISVTMLTIEIEMVVMFWARSLVSLKTSFGTRSSSHTKTTYR